MGRIGRIGRTGRDGPLSVPPAFPALPALRASMRLEHFVDEKEISEEGAKVDGRVQVKSRTVR